MLSRLCDQSPAVDAQVDAPLSVRPGSRTVQHSSKFATFYGVVPTRLEALVIALTEAIYCGE